MTSPQQDQDDAGPRLINTLANMAKKFKKAPLTSNIDECIDYYLSNETSRNALFAELKRDGVYHIDDHKKILECCGANGKSKFRVNAIICIVDSFPMHKFTTEIYELLLDSIDHLTKKGDAVKVAKAVVNRLAEEVNRLKETTNITLQDIWVRCFILLQSLSKNDTANDDEDSSSSRKSRGQVIKNLLDNVQWIKNVPALTKLFQQDFELFETEFIMVLKRIKRLMPQVKDIDALGPLVYQIMVLAQRGLPDVILKQTFDALVSTETELIDKRAYKDLATLRNDVISYSLTALSRDQELFKSMVKLVKSRELAPTPQVVAVLIGMIHFDASVSKDFATLLDEEYATSRKIAQANLAEQSEASKSSLSGVILNIAENITAGYTAISENLLDLAFALLLKRGTKKTTKFSAGGTTHSGIHSSDVGEKIITTLFEIFESSRSTIVNLLFKKVLVSVESMATVYAQILLSLLRKHSVQDSNDAHLVRGDSDTALLRVIEHNIDYILLHPPHIARMLVEAMIAVIDQHHAEALMDRLMMLFRKSLYDKDKDVREIATTGFLNILKNHSFASHVGQGAHTEYGGEEELKILGLLQRCLAQGLEMRRLVYRELFDVLVRRSELEGFILNVLHKNFLQYTTLDDRTPLDLEQCVSDDRGQLIEPLADLLFVMQRAVACPKKDSDQCKRVRETVEQFCTKLVRCSISDFDMESEDMTFDDKSDEGKIARARAELLLSLYQVAMQYLLMANVGPKRCHVETVQEPLGADVIKKIVTLFTHYNALLKTATKHSVVKGEKGYKKFTDLNINMISMDALLRFFETFYCDLEDDETEFARSEFLGFLLKLYRKELRKTESKGHVQDLAEVCSWLMQIIIHTSKHVEKHQNTIAQCIWDTFELVRQMEAPQILLDFVGRSLREEDEVSPAESTDFVGRVVSYIGALMATTCGGDEEAAKVQSVPLFKMLTALSSFLPRAKMGEHLRTLLKVCNRSDAHNLDANLITHLFSHIALVCSSLDKLDLLEKFAKQIDTTLHAHGQIDVEYHIIDPETAKTSCLDGLIKPLPDIIHNIEWKFNEIDSRMKSVFKTYKGNNRQKKKDEKPEFQPPPDLLEEEKILYKHLLLVVKTAIYLTNAHPMEPTTKEKEKIDPLSLIKIHELLYKLVGRIGKYELDYRPKNDDFAKVALKCNKLGAASNRLIQFSSKNNKNKTKHRVLKENKQMAGLVFVREKYEQFLIGLSAKWGHNLMEGAEKLLVPQVTISKRKRKETPSPKKKSGGTQKGTDKKSTTKRKSKK